MTLDAVAVRQMNDIKNPVSEYTWNYWMPVVLELAETGHVMILETLI